MINPTKSILFLAALALVGAPLAQAQADNPPPPPKGERCGPNGKCCCPRGDRGMGFERRVQHLDKALKLTDDQKTKIKAIYKNTKDQMQALNKDESLTRKDFRAKMQEIMKSTHAQVRTVLTPDQQAKFDKMGEPKGGPGKHGGKKDDAKS